MIVMKSFYVFILLCSFLTGTIQPVLPMYGETVTAGFATEMDASSDNRTLQLRLEAWNVDAFADMLMEHVEPGVRDMHLVSLGDVSQRNALAALP